MRIIFHDDNITSISLLYRMLSFWAGEKSESKLAFVTFGIADTKNVIKDQAGLLFETNLILNKLNQRIINY